MLARINRRAMGTALIVIVALADQWAKWAVTETLFRPRLGLGDPMRLMDWLVEAPRRMGDVSITVTKFFNLSMVWNEGISFGLMHGGGWGFLTVMSLGIAAFFFLWMHRTECRTETVALALIVGGALGNAFDRIRFGAVVDFLDFHTNHWHFPAFNLADSAITAGVVLLLIQGLFFAKNSG